MGKSVFQLPDNFDPYDMRLKVQFHEKADRKNVIVMGKKNPRLACGAVTGDKVCKRTAGSGTDHLGYGRCSIHGGCSVGPTTEEGKAKVRLNGLKHGLYSKTLLPGESDIFNALCEDETPTDLAYEINILKTKIISYLMRSQATYAAKLDQTGDEDTAYKSLKVWYSDGDGVRNHYHAATIEDGALDRALRTLRSLVETQNRILGDEDSKDIIDVINKELQAASQGKIALSWSAPSKVDENSSNNCSTDADK